MLLDGTARASVRDDLHILTAELLLEFTNQALLNLVVRLQRSGRDRRSPWATATETSVAELM